MLQVQIMGLHKPPVYTRILTRIQPRFTSSVNPDCNPDWLNPYPLVDWNSVRDRKWVEPRLELLCKHSYSRLKEEKKKAFLLHAPKYRKICFQ